MSFDDDLKEGNKVEEEVLELIKNTVAVDTYEFGKTSDWDILIWINGVPLTFEIKHDKWAVRTGNVGIEYHCRGKSSGIRITKADYWVMKLCDEYWSMKTVDLKGKLIADEYDSTKVGGDKGSNTRFYLINLHRYTSWCQRLGGSNGKEEAI